MLHSRPRNYCSPNLLTIWTTSPGPPFDALSIALRISPLRPLFREKRSTFCFVTFLIFRLKISSSKRNVLWGPSAAQIAFSRRLSLEAPWKHGFCQRVAQPSGRRSSDQANGLIKFALRRPLDTRLNCPETFPSNHGRLENTTEFSSYLMKNWRLYDSNGIFFYIGSWTISPRNRPSLKNKKNRSEQ